MKFSIRDLLLVTVIVALAVGWWVNRRRLAQTIESQHEQLETLKTREAVAKAVAEATATVEAAMKESLDTRLNSSEPAANPPKP